MSELYQPREAVINKQSHKNYAYIEELMKEKAVGQSILDIGCAEGFVCYLAERYGAKDVFGIDKNRDRIKSAKEHVGENGVCNFKYGNIMKNLSILKGRKVVIMSRCLYYLSEKEVDTLFKTLKKAKRMLLIRCREEDKEGLRSPENVLALLDKYKYKSRVLKDEWIIGRN